MSVITPNMNLIESTVGVDSGLSWEQNLNSSLTLVDQHNHTPGYGVQIPPSGLNINTSLNFQNQQAVSLQASVYQPQATLSVLNAVYVSGVDLYYNDGSGNVIRLTTGGAVNATSSGITSGSATASFVSSVLVVNAASNTPANIQVGSVLLGNNSAGSKFLTLSPPSSMGANFSLTLPTLPSSQKIMTLDASGNMSAPYTVDNSTIAISSNVIGVPVQGIAQNNLAFRPGSSGTGSAGQIVFDTVSSYSNATFSYTTAGSVTLTGTGRPILIFLQPSGTSTSQIQIGNTNSTPTFTSANIKVLNGSTTLGVISLSATIASGSPAFFPLSSVYLLDYSIGASAGTYTYTIQAEMVFGSGGSIVIGNFQVMAYEI